MGSSSLSNVQVFTPRRHVDLPAAFNAHGSGFNRGTLLLFFYLPHPNPSRPFLMETAVRKATRLEYQPPKRKHLDTLVALTHQSPANIEDIMHTLSKRMKETSWIIVFKVLIIIHTLMREGADDCAASYVYHHLGILETNKLRDKSSTHTQVQNIRIYKEYLARRAEAYGELRKDLMKPTTGQKEGRLRHLSTSNGLLKETQVLQKQIASILSTNLLIDGVDEAICLYAYRLIVEDLLSCSRSLNEGIVNILEHYFAMSKSDAQTSLGIYKRFTKQIEDIISYLNQARRLQSDMQINIPNLKHAPLSLATALEEYLNDPNYEAQREAYIRKKNNPEEDTNTQEAPKPVQQQQQPSSFVTTTTTTNNLPSSQPASVTPNQSLDDFFGSIQNQQTAVIQQQQPLTTGSMSFVPSQQTSFMGSPQQLNPVTMTNTGSSHNPFRMSTLPPQPTGSLPSLQQQPSFNRANSMMIPSHRTGPAQQQTTTSNPFRTMQPLQAQMTGWQQQPQMTGASTSFLPPTLPLQQPNPTGSSNPFASSNPPPSAAWGSTTF
ncbi:enth domain-containing protein [Lichtheimia corymbifera JMRC:FSU:9682]|uniref:Enth domain-containing protein n=1 Tax=Lichtheimia corymbifera JMRC:FSU:9682 TaxID=1263082 RepID=A0A068SCH8_9FUNG|nr:enth domain-containing protein [Lichtheimia corymbifera JMRC:FSU:9682]